MSTCFLAGNRIYLRGLKLDDLEGNYVNWFNDATVCKYNSHHVFPYSKESATKYIRDSFESRSALILAIVLLESDVHIGNVALQSIDYISRTAEFAIIIGEQEYWGKGYAKEASMLILNHGFMELGLHRIHCGTSSDNVPMQSLALSLGMIEEGRRRQAVFKHGTHLDIVEYGLLRYEYKLG